MKDQYLLNKGYLRIGAPSPNWAYINAKLIEFFGVFVDKPELLNEKNLEFITSFYGCYIPDSFYANPQDTANFSADELAIEQFVSYLKISYMGVRDMDPDTFKRVPVFDKILPERIDGDEVVVRKYIMITDEEADEILRETVRDLCENTRPWNESNEDLFHELMKLGLYEGEKILCADNAVCVAEKTFDPAFARMITKKDVVKFSVKKFGEQQKLELSKAEKDFIAFLLDNASDFPMTKKQAKYFNTLMKKTGRRKSANATNAGSPYKEATALMKQGDVVGAAKVFARNGSLLERNLVYLFSRVDEKQTADIIDLMKGNNPIVLLQSIIGVLNGTDSGKRTFFFTKDRRLVAHTETDEEQQKRRSVLTEEKKEIILRAVKEKILAYYRALPSIGKIYVSEEFKRVAIPFNTETNGKGLDVLPTGSRTPIEGNAIRLFCYWKDAFDIDVSALFMHKDGKVAPLNWALYSEKLLGDMALHSGDCRDKTGAEYIDVKVDELANSGFETVYFMINGYQDRLDAGEIYCGYQNKVNLNTKAWSPKNIKYKIAVRGDSRMYYAFAIDLTTKEMVTLNLMSCSEDRIIDYDVPLIAKRYGNATFLEYYNMYSVLCEKGETVDDPKDAEIVFSSDYIPLIGQKVVKPADTEKLIALLR